ncbi:MAG: arsenic metallochaperone ArsD family protein [Ignavibacteriales bacterium]|nr:arsenic metallochaperone ArsD family protein [Ignavibacteriales bacterium]
MFVQNVVVRDFIKANGPGKLPLVLLDNQIIKSGGYPTTDELKAFVPGLNEVKPRQGFWEFSANQINDGDKTLIS